MGAHSRTIPPSTSWSGCTFVRRALSTFAIGFSLPSAGGKPRRYPHCVAGRSARGSLQRSECASADGAVGLGNSFGVFGNPKVMEERPAEYGRVSPARRLRLRPSLASPHFSLLCLRMFALVYFPGSRVAIVSPRGARAMELKWAIHLPRAPQRQTSNPERDVWAVSGFMPPAAQILGTSASVLVYRRFMVVSVLSLLFCRSSCVACQGRQMLILVLMSRSG